jgi:hypothetical protein
MITIVLMDKNGKFLEKVSAANNERYLLLTNYDDPQYPLVSELSDSDLDVFSSKKMPQLIQEFEALKKNLLQVQKEHISEIIRLAKICKENPGYTLGFTPFGEFL